MILREDDIRVLVDFAEEGEKPNGCTGYGPKFDAVMALARRVRRATTDTTIPGLVEIECPNCRGTGIQMPGRKRHHADGTRCPRCAGTGKTKGAPRA